MFRPKDLLLVIVLFLPVILSVIGLPFLKFLSLELFWSLRVIDCIFLTNALVTVIFFSPLFRHKRLNVWLNE